MSSILLDKLTKSFGKFQAIKSMHLAVRDGEFLALLGPSGCGKSTTMNIIAGMEAPTTGRVLFGTRDVTEMPMTRRGVGFVFQNYAIFTHMSVRQNLAYGLRNRGTHKDEIARRIAQTAKVLEIEPFLDRKPRQLSGGQRQRVAMGRAIVREPAAFLFDEPLSNLDAKLRVSMRGEIKRLQKRLGTTSIYVTHDQLEAMTLADRLVVLNGGRIEQIGAPLDVCLLYTSDAADE